MPDQHWIPLGPATLVVLCGISGSGKSTFAAQNFMRTQIVSSDECRALLSDDPTNQWVSGSAFRLLHWIISERLRLRRTTVVDSTALDRGFRRDMLKLAEEHRSRTMLIFFDTGKESSLRRDQERPRAVGSAVIDKQYPKFLKALEDARSEPWDRVEVIKQETMNTTSIVHPTGSFDLRYRQGPFDVIGDVHGCLDELQELIRKLGYRRDVGGTLAHPRGRTLIFLGDLADRGPYNTEAFSLVMPLVEQGVALYTPGNHCDRLLRYLKGKRVSMDWGLDGTVRDVEARDHVEPGFKERMRAFIEAAPTYLWLDGGSLVVAHGGIKADMIGKDNSRVRAMVLYGDTTGRNNPDGTPERLDWAKDYNGEAAIVYGHTPVPGPHWRNNTINIDQGCVFGGWLSAVRWPERTIEQVSARQTYFTARTPEFIRSMDR